MPRPFVKGNDTLSFPPHLVISERQSSPDDVAGSLEACVFSPKGGGGRANQGGQSLFSVVSHGDALWRGQRVTGNTVLFWDRDTSFLPVQLNNSLCQVGIFHGGLKRSENGLGWPGSGQTDTLSGEETFVRVLRVEVAGKLRPMGKTE